MYYYLTRRGGRRVITYPGEMEKVLLSSRRRIFRLERNDIERISARNSGGCLVLNTAKGRRRAAFAYSGRRKIEIASLLNLTLEEAGTLKREREGEEYQATRASLAASSNANRVLGEQGFVNFGTSRGCVKILAIKRSARKIQFPWEKRFQRSSLSLFLSRIRCSFRIENRVEGGWRYRDFYRC